MSAWPSSLSKKRRPGVPKSQAGLENCAVEGPIPGVEQQAGRVTGVAEERLHRNSSRDLPGRMCLLLRAGHRVAGGHSQCKGQLPFLEQTKTEQHAEDDCGRREQPLSQRECQQRACSDSLSPSA